MHAKIGCFNHIFQDLKPETHNIALKPINMGSDVTRHENVVCLGFHSEITGD